MQRNSLSGILSTMTASASSAAPLDPAVDDGVALLVNGKQKLVGGFPVTRALPTIARKMIGPFIFLDHMGPFDLPPGSGLDVLPHPHIGLSTVTYLFEGDGLHRDSLGNVQTILPGDVNLMTAGRGIVHSERSTPASRAAGGRYHGLQLWVALTEEEEDGDPSFLHVEQTQLPLFEATGVSARILLGDAFGLAAPVRHASRPVLIDVRLAAGATMRTPASAMECGVYVVAGSIRIGARELASHSLAVLSRTEVMVQAEADSRVLVLGGPALGRRYIDWNFVSSSRERIERAKEDWKARRFPSIPGDDIEFVPLPEPRRPT